MQSEINKILKLNNFFNLISINKNVAKYSLKKPSTILLNNIYVQWLTSIWQKTDKHFPIFVTEDYKNSRIPFGYIKTVQRYKDNIIDHDCTNFLPKQPNNLQLNILMSRSEIMQYFLQWQRYRKYWWSTVTTSPGLFSLSDIRYDDQTEVDVLAHLPWGKQPVENIRIYHNIEELVTTKTPTSIMESSMSLEGTLYTLLLDGLLNQTPEEYLRLNKSLAPYKLAFALDCQGENNKKLEELALLLNYKINSNGVSTWNNDFSLPLHEQLLSCRRIGIPYVAVIDENVLSEGIFGLMNSSTMLQVISLQLL